MTTRAFLLLYSHEYKLLLHAGYASVPMRFPRKNRLCSKHVKINDKDMNNSNNTNYQAKLAVSKSLLKEYRTSDSPRTVYMSGGTEFQIQLFNPKSTEIACRVFINDEELSNMIVLRPGERLWLERFTDRAEKFLFETYTVDGNGAQVRGAIKDNGTIRVQFYYKKNQYRWPQTLTAYNSYTWSHAPYPAISTIYYNSTDDLGCKSNYYCNVSDTANCAPVSSCITTTDALSSDVNSKEMETGRITRGSHSNQAFESVDMEFESWSYQTETLKILPVSQKPMCSEDLVKRYCPMCGRKVVEKYKFCPYCGKQL